MNKVIVVTSGKGGVGKTTSTANIGTGLALLRKRVVLVDTDIGLRNLDVLLGLENRIVFDLIDVISGTCRLKQALIKDDRYEGLYLLPAAQTCGETPITPNHMRTVIAELEKDFDYVLIDCPAGIDQGFANAISGAKSAIVVTVPEIPSVRDADRVIGLLSSCGIGEIRLLVNRFRSDLVRRGDMLSIQDLTEILGAELIGVIPEDEKIFRSGNLGEPVAADPSSAAGRAYGDVARRIAEKDGLLEKPLHSRRRGLREIFKKKKGASIYESIRQKRQQ